MDDGKNSDSKGKKIQEKKYLWILVVLFVTIILTVLANVLMPLWRGLFNLIGIYTFKFEITGITVYIPWLGILLIAIALISIRFLLSFKNS